MPLRLLLTSAAALSIFATGAFAQSSLRPVASRPVLELFTSQGCSSCPPADVLFKSYVGRSDVIALSMPVDYWDYLGWKDTLASPKFSKRQRTYASARGDGQVYTPQIVINGRAHVVGSSRGDVENALKAAAASPSQVAMKIGMSNGNIEIELPASAASSSTDMMVWLAVVQAEVQVDVRAGENRGRKLTYVNVVRDLVPAGVWNGKAMTIRHQASALTSNPTDRIAVLVQSGTGGALVAGARIEPTS